jgi:1-acyl-sn-glycerol-3-phosphate acyltransferase
MADSSPRVQVTHTVKLPPFSFVIARLLGALALLVVFRWRIEGRENLPQGGFVVIANHLNWLDSFAVVLALHWRPRIYLVGWDTVLRSPKLAWLVRNSGIGFVPVERDQPSKSPTWHAVWGRMMACLNEGSVLMLFPEGTVGHDEGRLMAFRPGFAKVALASGATIVPLALSGTRDLWFRKRILVRIGRPIQAAHDETCASLQESGRLAIQQLLPAYVEPEGRKLWRRRLTRLIPSLTDTQADP